MAEGRGEIAGYEFGMPSVVRSPLGIEDLDLLKQTVLFGEEDEELPGAEPVYSEAA